MRILFSIVFIMLAGAVAAVFALQAPTKWDTGEVIRTPDERFADLEGYPFAPNYVEALGYRVHYVDEGPRDGETILLMHGQPSWSYLYRHMIPALAAAGYRVIAPDLVGFGRSDKPLEQSDHSYQMHIDVMAEVVRQLDLEDATLFAQDWGGLIGLRVVPEEPDRFARIMISNTGLPAAGGIRGWIGYPLFRLAVLREGTPDAPAVTGEDFRFSRWVAWAANVKNFDVGAVLQGASQTTLSPGALAAYQAPFPDEQYQAAIRVFPGLVPSQLRQNQRVLDEFYARWEKPFLTAFGDKDPVTRGADAVFRETVPGAQGQPHTTVTGGGHFIQEDRPDELVSLLTTFIEANPRGDETR
ncbi:MAG: haloalkane dehalogenase [Pseudomonadota bacterium]